MVTSASAPNSLSLKQGGWTVRLACFTADADAWDSFVQQCPMATLLHTRRFLSYHAHRFTDASLWVEHNGEVVAVLPAAEHPADPSVVCSHPGATFGGLLYPGQLKGTQIESALACIAEYYRNAGYSQFQYKPAPPMYHQQPSQGDGVAMHALGATVVRCDMSATIDLPNRPPWNKKRIKNMKQVAKHNIEIRQGNHQLPAFWSMLENRLHTAHDTAPTHSLEEILLLADRFPDDIVCWGGYYNGELVAGTVMFYSPTVAHTQYIASTESGRKLAALDALLEALIVASAEKGYRFFDFGHSHYRCAETGSWLFNDGLHKFKCKFGAGETVYTHFALSL